MKEGEDELGNIPGLEAELKYSVLQLEEENQDQGNVEAGKGAAKPLGIRLSLSQLIFAKEQQFRKSASDELFIEFVIKKVLYCLEYVKDYLVDLNVKNNDISVVSITVNLKPIQVVLERLFVRNWNTFRDFERILNSDDFKLKQSNNSDAGGFFTLIDGMIRLCEEEANNVWISRRVITQFLLGLNRHVSDQIAKLCFLVGCRESCSANLILQPIESFISKTTLWEKSLIDNIGFKISAKNQEFWTNWANYIMKSSRRIEILQVSIHKFSRISACAQSSTAGAGFTERTLIPATVCLIALVKEYLILLRSNSLIGRLEIDQFNIFHETLLLMEHVNIDVRCCGAIAGLVLRELLNATVETKSTSSNTAAELPELEFETLKDKPLYKNLRSFLFSTDEETVNPMSSYTEETENQSKIQEETQPVIATTSESSCALVKADTANNNLKITQRGNLSQVFEGMDSTFVSKVRFWKLTTFNELLEVFMEPPKELSDYEVSVIKKKALLRIPVLISSSYKLDPTVAAKFAKILADLEFGREMNLPLILALYKLIVTHPLQVSQMLGDLCFNTKHYSLGQRFQFLQYYLQMIQLLSGRKCFTCISDSVTPQSQIDWKELDEVFWKYFVQEIYLFRRCFQCRRNGLDVDSVFFGTTKHGQPWNSPDPAISHQDQGQGDGQVQNLPSTTVSVSTSKTRRFASASFKIELHILDAFSNQFSDLIWYPIQSNLSRFFETNTMEITGIVVNYLRLTFQLLIEIIQGTSCSAPFVLSIGHQIADFVIIFHQCKNSDVRLSSIHLLAIYLHHTKGNAIAIENLNKRMNIFQYLENYLLSERNMEISQTIKRILLFSLGANSEDGFKHLLQQSM